MSVKQDLALITAGSSVLFLGIAFILLVWTQALLDGLYGDRIPLEQLGAAGWKLPPGYLSNALIVLETTIWTLLLAGALGYFFDKMIGALALELFTILAAILCFLFALLPAAVNVPPDLSLLAGIALVGLAGAPLFSALVLRGKGAGAVKFLWFGYCLACWVSYQAAGWPGLLLITPLILLAFWGALFYFSQKVLPIQPGQRLPAFRSLLTFTLGTNYPYYVIEDWRT